MNYWKGFRRITAFPLHLSSWNFTCRLAMRQGCALLISGSKDQRSRSNPLISGNGFLRITAFPLHPWSQNLTGTLLSQGCALLISGSKGQRSRSQCINYWKWLLAHNCYPFILVMGDRLNFIIDHQLESEDAFDAILPIIIGTLIFTELNTFYALWGTSEASGFFSLSECKWY